MEGFRDLNKGAHDIYQGIRKESGEVTVKVVPFGTKVSDDDPIKGSSRIGTALMPFEENGQLDVYSPGRAVVVAGKPTVYLLDPDEDLGVIPGSLMSDGKSYKIELGEVGNHETSHAFYRLWGAKDTRDQAVGAENNVRRTKNPNGAYRKRHDLQ